MDAIHFVNKAFKYCKPVLQLNGKKMPWRKSIKSRFKNRIYISDSRTKTGIRLLAEFLKRLFYNLDEEKTAL